MIKNKIRAVRVELVNGETVVSYPLEYVSAYPELPEKMDMTDAFILSNRLYGKLGRNRHD